MERLQNCVQVDGEYVGWPKRTQYIEIDFNHEIRLCYTWRGTPSISIYRPADRRADQRFISKVIVMYGPQTTYQLSLIWFWSVSVHFKAGHFGAAYGMSWYVQRNWRGNIKLILT
jgi:hypothetical protein